MQGLHILAELYDCRCPSDCLLRPSTLEEICRTACDRAGLTIVATAFHGFGTEDRPAGATGTVVLAESHLAVHAWPEIGVSGAVTLDLYVCNFSRDNRDAAELAWDFLVNAFRPERVERRDIQRGEML